MTNRFRARLSRSQLALALLTALFVPGAGAGQRLTPRPEAQPPAAPALPAPVVRTLSNGLRVVLIERHSAPLVSVNAMVKAGAECDPPGRAGMAEMVASLLPEGTDSESALEIAQAVDQAGGTIDTGADWDKSLASVIVLQSRRQLAFKVLSEILIHPTFRDGEIERLRKQMLSALQVLWQDPDYVADAVIRRLIFNGTPYGHPADGTIASNRRITRAELLKFHGAYYRPGNTIVAILGDISAEEGFRLAEKYFGGWKGGEVAIQQATATSQEQPSARVVVIDKPDAVQTEIRVGEPAIPRSNPDFGAFTLANQILGGPAANRLFQALRSERGLVYGASSELDCYRAGGAWIAKTSTRTPETLQTLHVILEEIKLVGSQPVRDSELSMAKHYLAGHEALEFESMNGVAAHTLELFLYGLPLDYWNNFPSEIDRLSSSGILTTVSPYLRSTRDQIVLVGNSSEFAAKLKHLGPVKVIPINRLDIESPNLERAGATPNP